MPESYPAAAFLESKSFQARLKGGRSPHDRSWQKKKQAAQGGGLSGLFGEVLRGGG